MIRLSGRTTLTRTAFVLLALALGPTAAMNPAQFWMNVAEQWQKSWADSMKMWTNIPRGNT